MPHNPTIRILPDADTAVLLIHGICGSPTQFRRLLPLEQMIPENWSVYNIVLDGHCKTVGDFSRSSMKKWKAQVQSVFDELSVSHRKVILVGHSMGTLLSIDLAIRNPEKVGYLFLLGVPVRVGVRHFGITNLFRVVFGRLDTSDPVQTSMGIATGMILTRKLWKYTPWAPRMVELLHFGYAIGKQASLLSSPAVAWQSRNDEMVSNRSAVVLRRCGKIQVHEMAQSTHFYYAPWDKDRILESFSDMIQCIQNNTAVQ